MNYVIIQMKVYEKDGRRIYVREALLPEFVTSGDAAKWADNACTHLEREYKRGEDEDLPSK